MKNISKLSDEEVVVLICKENKELFSEIIKRYKDKLLRYANYLVSDNDLASDIVQESFIKTYINLKGFDSKKKFSSWIYRIVHNESINMLRKIGKNVRVNENFEFDSGINLEDEFIKKEIISQTHSCLKEIPIIYKEPLSLYFLEQKSYEEIGDILKIPISTVGTRVSRGKMLMKKICQKK